MTEPEANADLAARPFDELVAELRLREAELTISELGRGMGADAGDEAASTEGQG